MCGDRLLELIPCYDCRRMLGWSLRLRVASFCIALGSVLVACLVFGRGFTLADQVDVAQPFPLGTVGYDATLSFDNWVRPSGPPRVALQAGHWKKDEVPEEQNNLRWNGAVVAGVREEDVTLRIAKEAGAIIEKSGIVVDILPTTVPPGYVADAFVAIHADKHTDRAVSGYKVAASAVDLSGASELLANAIESSYGVRTGMLIEPNVSDGMREYYAFNWRLYQHSLHPMTPAVILEAGFLSNANDRRYFARSSQIMARGIADGILEFLKAREVSIE